MRTAILLLTIVIVATFLSGCGKRDPNSQMAEAILGTWKSSTAVAMAETAQTYIFKKSGEIEIQWGRNKPSVKGFVQSVDDPSFQPTETGSWEISANMLKYQITECNMGEHEHPYRQYGIVDLTKDKLVLGASDGDQTFFRWRNDQYHKRR